MNRKCVDFSNSLFPSDCVITGINTIWEDVENLKEYLLPESSLNKAGMKTIKTRIYTHTYIYT